MFRFLMDCQMGRSKQLIQMQMVYNESWTETPAENSNESDYDRLPGLIDEHSEEDMGQEVYKRDHIDVGVQPRAPGVQVGRFIGGQTDVNLGKPV